MKLHIYAIFDSAVGAYMRPFFLQSDGAAKRAFKDLATDPNHDIGRHPEDYALFWLGTYCDQSSEFETTTGVCLAKAHELAAQVDAGHEMPGTKNSVGPLQRKHVEALLAKQNGTEDTHDA